LGAAKQKRNKPLLSFCFSVVQQCKSEFSLSFSQAFFLSLSISPSLYFSRLYLQKKKENIGKKKNRKIEKEKEEKNKKKRYWVIN
jgi:uncharacterized membrane protein